MSISFFIIFQWLLILQSNATQYDRIFIDGSSLAYLNGPYSWLYHDRQLKGSIYYKERNNQYLYPTMNATGSRQYQIDNNASSPYANAWCPISNTTPSYKFSIDNCYNNWYIYIKEQQKWKHDPNMILINIDSICIEGSIFPSPSLNGEYIWTHFNRTMRSSVYHLAEQNLYLFGYIIHNTATNNTNYIWMIGPDHTTFSGHSWCHIGVNFGTDYVFRIGDCIKWHTWLNGSLVEETHMTSKYCGFVTTQSDNTTDFPPPPNNDNGAFNIQIVVVVVVLSICCVVCLFFAVKRCINYKYKKENKDGAIKLQNTASSVDEHQPFNSPKARHPINKALVVIIGIGDYDTNKNKQIDTDINGDFRNFPVAKDVENLRKLFNMLQYTILPKEDDEVYNDGYWSQQKLIKFLEEAGKELVSVDESGELKYDALICAVSSHGIENHIITSDYKAVHKTAIHRIFSVKYKKSREIPRVFLFDCCEGPQSRIKTDETKNNKTENDNTETVEIGKYFGVENLGETKMWTNEENNPDYMLVEIHAANTGFEAKCSVKFGSYLLYEFSKKVHDNFQNQKQEPLGRIFEKIQNELHKKGKQQTINIFNNDTRYLVLEKHESDMVS